MIYADNKQFRMAIMLFLAGALILACSKKEPYADLVELDLISHGVPIVIKAPEGATVETMDQLVQRDITVKKDNDFSLQIFESDAVYRDPADIQQRLMREVQTNRFFQEIISEDEQGFIYKNAIDSNYVNYGFRHFLIQGDKEYIFQTALRGKFTLEQVERMKAAVE